MAVRTLNVQLKGSSSHFGWGWPIATPPSETKREAAFLIEDQKSRAECALALLQTKKGIRRATLDQTGRILKDGGPNCAKTASPLRSGSASPKGVGKGPLRRLVPWSEGWRERPARVAPNRAHKEGLRVWAQSSSGFLRSLARQTGFGRSNSFFPIESLTE